mmetsp:Transcript_15083/g.31662  ORF Transcript_15083/g.31662 Transcript_15083/m.31662 type:complete len:334 (+) Transcript_15083:729-1730(+)
MMRRRSFGCIQLCRYRFSFRRQRRSRNRVVSTVVRNYLRRKRRPKRGFQSIRGRSLRSSRSGHGHSSGRKRYFRSRTFGQRRSGQIAAAIRNPLPRRPHLMRHIRRPPAELSGANTPPGPGTIWRIPFFRRQIQRTDAAPIPRKDIQNALPNMRIHRQDFPLGQTLISRTPTTAAHSVFPPQVPKRMALPQGHQSPANRSAAQPSQQAITGTRTCQPPELTCRLPKRLPSPRILQHGSAPVIPTRSENLSGIFQDHFHRGHDGLHIRLMSETPHGRVRGSYQEGRDALNEASSIAFRGAVGAQVREGEYGFAGGLGEGGYEEGREGRHDFGGG